MSFMAGSIVGKMVLDRSKWSAEVKAVGKDTKTMGQWAKKNGEQFKKMGKMIGLAGIAAAGAIAFITKKASDAQEITAKFMTVFTDVMKNASLAVNELTQSYGLSSVKAKEMLGATGDLLSGLGTQADVALDLSFKTQKLAVDLASFSNFAGGAKGASDALTKAMLGERESVKALGIVITEEMVKERLLKEGKEKLTGQALLQAKAYATLLIATDQSKNAIGDYQRTSGSLANVVRTLNSRLSDLWVILGEKLVPIFAVLGKELTKLVEKSFKEASENTNQFAGIVISAFKTIATGIKGLMLAFETLNAFIFDMAAATTKVFRDYVGKVIAGFGQLKRLRVPLPKGMKDILRALVQTYIDLGIVQENYFTEADKHKERAADIIEFFDNINLALNKVKTGLIKGKEEVKSYGEAIIDTIIPPMKEQNQLLWEAIQRYVNLKKAREEESETARKSAELTEAENLAFWTLINERMAGLDMLMGTFEQWVTQGGSLMGHLGNMMKKMTQSMLGSLRQLTIETLASAGKEIIAQQAKALAGIIASVVKAIPFPLNIAAIGIGIALINKFFSALPSFAEGGEIGRRGGIVGEEGPELFVPDRPGTIIPFKEGAGPMRQITNMFSPTIQLNTLDPMTARDVVRDQIIPELFEAWKNKIGLRETQEALEIF